MFIRTYLTDKMSTASSELFKIVNLEGKLIGSFTVPHYCLSMENIKNSAKHTLGVRIKSKVYFENLDNYSANLLMIVLYDGIIEKYVIFK